MERVVRKLIENYSTVRKLVERERERDYFGVAQLRIKASFRVRAPLSIECTALESS